MCVCVCFMSLLAFEYTRGEAYILLLTFVLILMWNECLSYRFNTCLKYYFLYLIWGIWNNLRTFVYLDGVSEWFYKWFWIVSLDSFIIFQLELQSFWFVFSGLFKCRFFLNIISICIWMIRMKVFLFYLKHMSFACKFGFLLLFFFSFSVIIFFNDHRWSKSSTSYDLNDR